MKTVKVQNLTKETFAEFGEIIADEGREDLGNPVSHTWFPQIITREDATSINLMDVKPRELICQKFEAHDHTEENLLAMTGDVIVTCMPKGKISAEELKAFYVPAGTGVSFGPGVWHFVPFPVKETVACAVIFKNGTSSNDIYFEELPEAVGLEW